MRDLNPSGVSARAGVGQVGVDHCGPSGDRSGVNGRVSMRQVGVGVVTLRETIQGRCKWKG